MHEEIKVLSPIQNIKSNEIEFKNMSFLTEKEKF